MTNTKSTAGSKHKQFVSALNESGSVVDWWFIYKVPDDITPASEIKNLVKGKTSGFEYLYYDAQASALAMSDYLLNTENGALFHTLTNLFADQGAASPGRGWILYNDEIPNTVKNDELKGHTKGVVGFDTHSNSAFWLLHSTPRFPVAGSAELPQDERAYGQTYLCVTLPDVAAAEAIANVMLSQQQPQVYDCHLPDGFDKSSALYALANNVKTEPSKAPASLKLKSKAGKDFILMAKSRAWGKDFWIDLVGPELKTDLAIETWRRGKLPGTEDSNKVDDVEDVQYIDLSPLGVGLSWHYTKDHAKWAVSTNEPWVCVADINRQISQEKRGGGTLAFQDQALWNGLSKVDVFSKSDK